MSLRCTAPCWEQVLRRGRDERGRISTGARPAPPPPAHPADNTAASAFPPPARGRPGGSPKPTRLPASPRGPPVPPPLPERAPPQRCGPARAPRPAGRCPPRLALTTRLSRFPMAPLRSVHLSSAQPQTPSPGTLPCATEAAPQPAPLGPAQPPSAGRRRWRRPRSAPCRARGDNRGGERGWRLPHPVERGLRGKVRGKGNVGVGLGVGMRELRLLPGINVLGGEGVL